MKNKIRPLLDRLRIDYEEKVKTLHMECPHCGNTEKFSMLQANGFSICYRGSCDYGKRNFTYYISKVAKIHIQSAKDLIYGSDLLLGSKDDQIDLHFLDDEKPLRELKEIAYPANFEYISGLFPSDARSYLENRGVPLELIHYYEMKWNVDKRRVVLPIFMNHKCYGYQGRAIDQVDKKFRMLNNEGFNRESLVMFYDQIEQGGHIIINEGPFDALKFHYCGGNIATLGKVVTDKQIELIMAKKPKAIYLGLDDDAFEETRILKDKLRGTPIFELAVPRTAIDRCKLLDKKADFGECTFEEANFAFANAIPQRYDQVSIKLI
jgi:hypothetical protein